jgi:hypothetical protein
MKTSIPNTGMGCPLAAQELGEGVAAPLSNDALPGRFKRFSDRDGARINHVAHAD